MNYVRQVVIAITLVLSACADTPVQQERSYADSVLNRTIPADDNARTRECNWIRAEIAREKNLVTAGATIPSSPQQQALIQVAAQRNIATLEARAANIQCSATFSNAPAPSSQMNFDQCFARCMQYTSRTKEQCFDVCNK